MRQLKSCFVLVVFYEWNIKKSTIQLFRENLNMVEFNLSNETKKPGYEYVIPIFP